ncbi:K02A2.6-like [Cordylochernes scorpioides]|uniref:RNA-directed DNA polymerase n=1 Tax=Cordylochernes scorpioides TaxID=51811 RepID=A0ABY6KV05_9ARAC|nr:K02A2.6-like [Cordylochernes scorpioides]
MAQIQPPETFDFSTPNEWPKWRKRFERYLVVSGMKKKEEADKIDLFMYLMGDRADDIFRTFKFEKEEGATKIDSVLKAFDSHFCVRKNIIYERAKFNSRIQEDQEPVEEFITSLYKLADSCEFEGLHEQLIRDRIVVGVRDKALSERMQLDSELSLEKAVKMVRQQEAVRQQQVDLKRPSTSQKVSQVKFNSKKDLPKQQQQPSRKKEKSAKTRSRCLKCGGFTHREGQACRAEGQRCNLCSKTGHFANCCPDKQAKTAEFKAVSELDEEIGFLLEVSAVEDSSNLDNDEDECRRRWTAEIQVNGKKVKFKLDSQADVTCVPLCLFKKIMGQQRLVKSDINIRAAEFSELQTVGMFISTLRNGNYEIKEKIYVIRRLSEPLLSRRACELLNLARRIEVVATRINPIKEFPEVFEGLGQIGNPYEIKLKPGAKPYAVHTPRRVPIPLMEKLKTRLEELEKAGIIAQVNVATEWCAPTVIAGKPNGDIRLCVDLSRLNEHVQREVHPMPVVEHMLGQLGEARYFSKLDANSGFHQIPLSPDCQHLTTFITPFGRYKYCRMPFGISLAPEYFQRVMSKILQGMDGVMCYLDDILIFASDSKTHDRILRLVLRKLKEAKVTLNKAKCVFGVPRINFLGHILDEDGIRPDPAKIEAVAGMPAPTDVHGVRRFLGMVNHLGRFVENLSEIVAPLNQLLVKGQDFVWDCSQERAFRKLKKLLTTQPILAAYNVRKPTMVSSDASSYGLGAVLKQEGKNGIWRPVAYSSRTMTPTEKRYAQIEKEALAITWACERFQDFLLGKRFRIETDHKPLIPLFSTKELSSLTPRLQRFRMRMMRFGFEIVHIPGKELLDADALSRQPLLTTEGGEDERPTSAHINAVLSSITDKDEMLTKIFEAQQEDTTLKAVVNYLEQGWPDKKKMSQALLSYWHVKDELGVQNGLLMRSCRLVIPASMKLEILEKLHAGHFGITKTRLRACETVWWPGISEEIAETVRKCSVCIQEAVSKHEPLIPTNFPTRPWQKIGMDLFKFENKWYLVVIDYYSRFPEMMQLDRLTASVVVRSCKSIFARHGIPETVVSDNGTQFGAAREFANFARQYGFTHVTSSPRFPKSNGMAEAGVKIAKLILKKNQDPSLGLLEYRSTPLENGYSPAELLMGRKLRTTLPIAPENLNPKLVDSQTLKRKEGRRRKDMKSRYDRRCGATDMEELSEGDTVWITDMRTWGIVKQKASTPRSYMVDTPVGTLRRNRFHLRKGVTVQYPADPSTPTFSGEELVENEKTLVVDYPSNDSEDGQIRTRSGRIVKPITISHLRRQDAVRLRAPICDSSSTSVRHCLTVSSSISRTDGSRFPYASRFTAIRWEGIVPFTKFIKDFELVYDLRTLDDARKRILLDNHLRGAAREFALQSQQIRLGYEELKESLEGRFRKRVSTREMRSQFFSCRQGAGEKVRDFAARVSDLAAGAESDGLKIGISEVAEVFIDGLCPSLWEKAHLYQGEPWETLVTKLQWLEQREEDYREAQRRQERANNGGGRWPSHPAERRDYGDNTEDNRRGAPFRNWQRRPAQQPSRQQQNPPPPRQERRNPNGEKEENPGVEYKKQDVRRPPPKCYRSLGSEVLEVGAMVNGKPIREVRTTFEYCPMGEIGLDGILGLPGFRALKLHLSYVGSIRSDYERKEDPTKSAFLSSLQTIELSPQPPRIPLNEIHTGEDIFRAFSHCFCRDIRDMGNGSTITAPKLRMLTSKPVYRRQYPIPNRLVSKVKTLVDELEEVGIIEGSTSLWNPPLFPVAKTDGSVRITMDLRMINEATEFFPFPIPRVEDNLRAFAGAKVFSTLDLTSGFFQIHIPESDRDYFTFSLPWGRYRFTRLPQGAKNSAQVFQWAMNLVLGDLLFKCVRLYIDDVIVYSDSHEQHVADLAAVLERLSKFGLKAKYGKSYLFRDSVEYLGHVIDQNGIKPMWDNVAALRDLKRPHNIKAVRSLLGTVNYYRRFIPNAGEVLAPLSNLLRKGHRFAWGTIEQSAFETVKGILTSEPLLIHPTIGIPFILNTDASGIAVGACLQQEVNGTVRPIAYYSKRLTGPEIRYSTIEKEAYAVVLSLQHFKHLLAGSMVEVHTDHKPITYNKGSDYKNARLSRWAEIIQDFNVTFIYVPGKENTVADFLSRFPCEDDPNLSQDRRVVAAVVRDRRPPLLNSNQIWEGLLQEKGWAPVINRLLKLKSGSIERYNSREYRLQDNYLVTKNEKGTWVKVVPTGFRESVISYHHDIPTGGHFGVRKVMRRLKGDYYWPGMRTQVRKYIRRCESCQLSNQGVTKAASAPHFRPEKPFEHLALDFIGPLEATPRGYSSILTIVDLFTKFPILIPTKDQCANTVVRALLERIITTFGVPKTILSDRGSAFMSCVYKRVCKAMGVGAVNTTAWIPQSNGAVERLNRTVIESLRRCTAGNNLDTTLPMVAFAIRTTVHSSTGFTPAKLVFGHELRLPQPFQEEELNPVCEDSITEMAAFYERELVEEVEKSREMVRQTYLKEQQEARAEFEARELRTFEIGDLALVKRMHETKGRHKFEPRYRGPYEVLQRAGDTVYLLKDLETGNLDKIHIDRMKAYHASVKTYPTGDENVQEQIDGVIDDEDHWVHPTYPIYSHRTVEPEGPRETVILGNPLEVVNRTIGGNVGGPEIRRSTRVKKPTECRSCPDWKIVGGYDQTRKPTRLLLSRGSGEVSGELCARWGGFSCRRRKLSVQRQTSDNRSDIVVYDALSVDEMRVIQSGGWKGSARWKLFYILRSLEPILYGQRLGTCAGKIKTLYNGPRSPRPHHQEQWKDATSFRRPYQNTSKPQAPAPRYYHNTSKPQAPTPRYYQNKPLPQVSAPSRSYTPNPELKTVYPRKTYNNSPYSNRNRTEDGRPICFKCNKPGHVARYCRVRFVRIVEEDPIVTQDKVEEEIRMDNGTEKSRPLLYTDSTINGIKKLDHKYKININVDRIGICEALIDTGADLSVVDLSTALNTGLEIINPDKMCSGPDGKELDIVGNIVLNIKFHDKTITHQFVIMRTHLRIFILGRDFLKKMNAKIDCQREIIKYDLTGNRDVIKYQQKKIKSANDAIIPELSIKLIKAFVEAEDGEYIVEENHKMFQTNGLRLARSLINVENKETYIWITNPYPRPLKILKNQTLCFGSQPAEVNLIEESEQKKHEEPQFQINENLSYKEKEQLKQVLEKYAFVFVGIRKIQLSETSD